MRRVPGGCGPEHRLLASRFSGDAAPLRDGRARRRRVPGPPRTAKGVDVSGLAPARRRLHGFLLRLHRPGPEPDRVVLHGRDGARARPLDRVARGVARSRSSSSRPTTRPRWRATPAECRSLRIPFLYDPSQQVARLTGEELQGGMDGASLVIVNDYEFGILTQKTGLVARGDRRADPGPRRRPTAPEGSTISVVRRSGGVRCEQVPAARLEARPSTRPASATPFRAGLIRGLRIGAPWEVAGRMGSIAAVFALEAARTAARSLSRQRVSSNATNATSAAIPSWRIWIRDL